MTADDLDRIAADHWLGVHGPAPDVTQRLLLSFDAKRALQEIEGEVETIKHHRAACACMH